MRRRKEEAYLAGTRRRRCCRCRREGGRSLLWTWGRRGRSPGAGACMGGEGGARGEEVRGGGEREKEDRLGAPQACDLLHSRVSDFVVVLQIYNR